MELLINPMTKWAIIAEEQGSINYIEGMKHTESLPYVNDIITRPFLVHPETKKPVPVRVVDIQKTSYEDGHLLVVVVTRADRKH